MRAHGPTDKMFERRDAWLCQRRIATAAVWIWALCALIRALAPAALAEGYAFARASDTATVTRGDLRITVLGIGKFGSREPGAGWCICPDQLAQRSKAGRCLVCDACCRDVNTRMMSGLSTMPNSSS